MLQVMVTNVTSLLKTVKAVEDEATKGTRALEATIEHIKQELTVGPEQLQTAAPAPGSSPAAALQQVFNSSDPPPRTTAPEEFIRMTKGITMATAKAVAAGNSCRQEDIIATANLSRRAITDMLHSCKVGGDSHHHPPDASGGAGPPDVGVFFQQAAYHPEVSKEVQMRALRYGSECASGYLGLLEHVLVVRQDADLHTSTRLGALITS